MNLGIPNILKGFCLLIIIALSACQTKDYDPVVRDFQIFLQAIKDKEASAWGQKVGRKISYSEAYNYWHSEHNIYTPDLIKGVLESDDVDIQRTIKRMRNEM